VKVSELAATKWSGNDVKIATAVALAESRGKFVKSKQNTNGTYDLGPWQVNSVHGYDEWKMLTDEEYTVNAAYEVWQKQGWNAWTTYKSGAYLAFMGQDAELQGGKTDGIGKEWIPDAIGGAEDAIGGAVKDAAGSIPGVEQVGAVVNALSDASTWARIGKGTLGGVLIVMGVGAVVFVVANKVGSSPAANVIPAGRAVKALKGAKT
jgi:hypothetical protein